MAPSLKDPEADRLAPQGQGPAAASFATSCAISPARCAALPTLDDRSADEIIGCDAKGLPR